MANFLAMVPQVDPEAAAEMIEAYNRLLPNARPTPVALRPGTEVGYARPQPYQRTVRNMGPADVVGNGGRAASGAGPTLSQAEADTILGRNAGGANAPRSAWGRAKNAARGAAQAVRNGASAAARGIGNFAVSPLARGLGGAAALAGYGYYMGNRALNNPSLLPQYAQDAVNEDAGYQSGDLGNAVTQVVHTAVPGMESAMPEYPGELPPVPAGLRKNPISARSPVGAPVTRRRAGGRKRVAASTPAEAAPVTAVDPLEWYIRGASDRAGPMRDYSGPLITPAQLTSEELNAPESADLAFNRGIHTTAQAPQFGNDDLAVYDWQTGKPKTDIFGYQIRSADPRDHIGDPRWGTITQEMIDNYR